MASIPLPGQIIRASDSFNTVLFTPTTNFTVGTGAVSEGWYQTLGQWVLWGFRIQMGTSPSWPSTITVSLPVTAYAGNGTGLQASLGSWMFRDDSATTHYSGTMGVFDSGGLTASFGGAWSGTVPNSRISPGTPVTVAVTDILSGTGVYLAA